MRGNPRNQLLGRCVPGQPGPIAHRGRSREIATGFEPLDQRGQRRRIVQVEISHEVTANFMEHRDIAGHHGQPTLHAFHQRQSETLYKRGEDQRASMAVRMLQARIVELVEHEQAFIQLRMALDALD